MARNKSEEVQKLNHRIAFLEARLREMSIQATKGMQDTMSMMELVEEARSEAEKYKRFLVDAQGRPMEARAWRSTLLPWERVDLDAPLPMGPAVGVIEGAYLAPDAEEE